MGGLRFGLLGGFGASFLVVLGGCGARSSMLDPDATVMVGASRPSGGSTSNPGTGAGGSGAKPGVGATGGTTASGKPQPTAGAGAGAAGGAPGVGGTSSGGTSSGGTSSGGTSGGTAGSGTAGTPSTGASTGSGGEAGAGGVDPWAYNNCMEYCTTSAPAQPCPNGLSSADCSSSCEIALASVDSACQKVAGSLLQCLTVVYQNSQNCGDVQQLSAAKCGPLFSSYELCSEGTPTPPPAPPPPTPATCSASGSGGNGKCSVDMKCMNGAHYSAACYESSANQATCSCAVINPDGSATGSSFNLSESASVACQDVASLCGFPSFGLK